MGIGYFQLSVTSESDRYFVGNPQITFFKAVYKRHTNFAMENFILTFTGETFMGTSSNFGKNMYTIIPKNGDLVHKMYLLIDLEDTKSTDSQASIEEQIGISGLSLIDYIEVSIGDQVVDRHTGEWLHMFNETFLTNSQNTALCEMINTHTNTKGTAVSNKHRDGRIYIPLQFWFNRNPGLALPLLALHSSDVKINVKLNTRTKIKNNASAASTLQINKVQLLTQFIHLDKEEKNLFVSNSHEYLIEQVQSNLRNVIPLKKNDTDVSYESYQHKIEMAFNHPVKEIFWAIQDDKSAKDTDGTTYTDYYDTNTTADRTNKGNNMFNYWRNLDSENRGEQIIDATIGLNGKEIFDPLNSKYFMSIMKYQHHTGFGYKNINYQDSSGYQISVNNKRGSGFYCYSFALNPESHQPSGSLNFSKLDRADLRLRIRRDAYNNTVGNFYTSEKLLKIYAVNYNILKIVSGTGGLVFHN